MHGIQVAKQEGNRQIKLGYAEQALTWYSQALSAAQRNPDVPGQLISILYANCAFAHIKLESWINALRDCDHALQWNRSNVKALYRRALVQFHLGHIGQSFSNLSQFFNECSDDTEYPDANRLMVKVCEALPASYFD